MGVSVGTTAVRLNPGVRVGQRVVSTVENLGAVDIYVEFSPTVTSSTGVKVTPGEQQTFSGNDGLYAVTASGTSADVRVVVGKLGVRSRWDRELPSKTTQTPMEVDVRQFGADPAQPAATNDAAFSAASALAGALKASVVVGPGTYNKSAVWNIPTNAILDMHPNATIVNQGPGDAIVIEYGERAVHRIGNVTKTTAWAPAQSATTAAVRLRGGVYSTYYFGLINGHGIGIACEGISDPLSFSYNQVYVQSVEDCKTCLDVGPVPASSSWANSNTFIGGRVRCNGGSMYSTSVLIRMAGNGCTVIGFCVEGGSGVSGARSILFAQGGTANEVIGSRFEASAPIEFAAGAYYNRVLGGYGIAAIQIIDHISNLSNAIQAPTANLLWPDAANTRQGYEAQAAGGNPTMFSAKNSGGTQNFNVKANGLIHTTWGLSQPVYNGGGGAALNKHVIVYDSAGNVVGRIPLVS